MARHVPLTAARRRGGVALLILALLAQVLLVTLLIAHAPPSLHRGSVVLSGLLSVIVLGTGLLGLLWTRVILWPQQRQRLVEAQRVRRLSQLPAAPGSGMYPLLLLIGAGVLVAALLWTLLNIVGFIGAPMLWLIVSAINLETARQVHRVERREGVIYYEVPASPLGGPGRRLFVLLMP